MKLDRTLPRKTPPEPDPPLVLIVDDDAAVREGLSELLLSAGFTPAAFASTRDLLEAGVLDRPGCLILDVRMPGASGLNLQHRLAESGNGKPIVFLTGHGDIPMTVQAIKAGAVDFLTKPVRDQTLLDAVATGIAIDAARRAQAAAVRRTVERLATLTPREREVLHEVARGRLNKQIAFDLGISEVTVKLHRGNAMRKMDAASIGQLICAWETLPASLRTAVSPEARGRKSPETVVPQRATLGVQSSTWQHRRERGDRPCPGASHGFVRRTDSFAKPAPRLRGGVGASDGPRRGAADRHHARRDGRSGMDRRPLPDRRTR